MRFSVFICTFAPNNKYIWNENKNYNCADSIADVV